MVARAAAKPQHSSSAGRLQATTHNTVHMKGSRVLGYAITALNGFLAFAEAHGHHYPPSQKVLARDAPLTFDNGVFNLEAIDHQLQVSSERYYNTSFCLS
ncbi:hypothetical protein TRICI_001016 [Trichomonascus ciferrii]|uniref:Uncharacterized protein n=1 Tax=Trichomonascus ciferrii TaxID=44093 RepID=A0A642VBA0_9ASCO|nr:hypothetical protein TRICI_001016 [Trichomonascus ciferrii]